MALKTRCGLLTVTSSVQRMLLLQTSSTRRASNCLVPKHEALCSPSPHTRHFTATQPQKENRQGYCRRRCWTRGWTRPGRSRASPSPCPRPHRQREPEASAAPPRQRDGHERSIDRSERETRHRLRVISRYQSSLALPSYLHAAVSHRSTPLKLRDPTFCRSSFIPSRRADTDYTYENTLVRDMRAINGGALCRWYPMPGPRHWNIKSRYPSLFSFCHAVPSLFSQAHVSRA